MQTGNSTRSGFSSWAGRFRNIGLVGSAIAVLIGFIEAVAVHAAGANSDDATEHHRIGDISAGVATSTGEEAARQLSHSGSASQDVLHQLANGGAAFEGVAHEVANSGAAFEGVVHEVGNGDAGFEAAAHQVSTGGFAYQDAADQIATNGSSFEEAVHYYQLSNSGSAPGDTTSALADDAALSASLSSIDANGDHDAGSALANSDSFWFNADGPVHLNTDADHSLHSAADSFAAITDVSADHSAPSAEVTFTSAELSSFQYSGPSILDTAPGGASAHWSDVIDAGSNDISPANVAAGANEPSDVHQASSIANIQNNVFAISGASLKSEAGTAQVLEAWNGDLGTGYAGAGASTGGSSGSVPGVVSASNGQGFVINVVYDSSVSSAPAGFTQTIANVVNFYESQFSTPLTITIDVGFGEIDGQSVAPGALGESQTYMTPVSYSQLEAALVNNANAIGDTAAAASLSASSPVGGEYWIPTAEAQALGLASAGGLDGYAGFTNVPYLDYNVSNSSGTVPGSQYDFFGVVAHEFSEIMGRQMLDGAADFDGVANYTALDLFHYSAPGVRDFSGTTPGYFSPDGGYTNLGNFNTNPYGDFGDWAGSVGNNSYLAYSSPGQLDPVTASDINVMNLLGWDFGLVGLLFKPAFFESGLVGAGSSGNRATRGGLRLSGGLDRDLRR